MKSHGSVQSVALLMLALVAMVFAAEGQLTASARPMDTAANAGWEEIYPGSATGSGVSNLVGGAGSPSLAISPDGTPAVAFSGYIKAGAPAPSDIHISGWENGPPPGGISNTTWPGEYSALPALAFHSGNPIVAWQEYVFEPQIFVRRWDGGAWVEMGGSASESGISQSSFDSREPAMVVGADGPVVAWYEVVKPQGGGGSFIAIRRWDGKHWIEMSEGIFNDTIHSDSPSLGAGPDGAPFIAWRGSVGLTSEIYGQRWNGSAWEEIGDGSATGGGISDNSGNSLSPSAAVGLDGMPIVAWQDDSSGSPEIYIRRWNGSDWEEVGSDSASSGGISNSAGAQSPSLAIGIDGAPVVAWADHSSGNGEIYVRRWNGTDWEEMGSGSASGGGISDAAGYSYAPSLAIGPDGTSVVAWQEGGSIYVRRFPNTTCYTLTLTHSGQGDDPTADPANSLDCPTGRYRVGELVTLTTLPATWHRVSGWSGTNDDDLLSLINALTMPAVDHIVSVAYEEVPGWAFFPLVLSHIR